MVSRDRLVESRIEKSGPRLTIRGDILSCLETGVAARQPCSLAARGGDKKVAALPRCGSQFFAENGYFLALRSATRCIISHELGAIYVKLEELQGTANTFAFQNKKSQSAKANFRRETEQCKWSSSFSQQCF